MELRAEQALIAMRRLLRATEMGARRLAQDSGLTTSQVVILGALAKDGEATAGELARLAKLSQPSVTAIVDKLVARGLAVRRRGETDRRRVWVEITASGRALLAKAPDTLQSTFVARFAALQTWEQAFIIAALERIASLLDADALDAAPILDLGAVDRSVTEAEREGDV